MWNVAKTGNHQGLIVCEETGRNVAVAYDKADAPLLAAAPDLLAVAEEVLNAIDAFPHAKQRTPLGKPNGGIAKALRAAIERATAE